MKLIKQLFLILLSTVLFTLANPNPLFNEGFGFLAYLIYLPIFAVINHSSIKSVWFYGMIYGALSYGLYGYWLQNFHPLGLIIVCICYALILAVVFVFLKIIDLLFSRNAWLVQWLFICVYEYLKTLGFIGFSYGVTAYTQWKYSYLIQICDVVGIFGLNLIVLFPSAFIFSVISKSRKKSKIEYNLENQQSIDRKSNTSEYVLKERALKNVSRKSTFICGGVWCLIVLISMIYGYFDLKNKKNTPVTTVKITAIQHNEDSWKDGFEEYSKNVQKLMELTDEALEFSPDINFVVWPETAITPSIMKNYYERQDLKRYKLVSSILNYIESKKSVFVIGNAHVEDHFKGELERYNSVFVFAPGTNVIPPEPEIYSKMKLVPFVEEFPYKTRFPKLYVKLLNGDTHMWNRGSEYKVFRYNDFSFSTPICFEDTFDSICRNMVLNGSRCFLNLSNDSWSRSNACQYQHLAMAVFRSVENRVPSVRSTTSGQTCIIDENGKINAMIPSFCQSYVTGNVSVYNNENFKESIYTKFGNYIPKFQSILFILILIIQIIRVIIIERGKNGRKN